MRYLRTVFIITLLSQAVCQAQVIKGRISNQSGDPVQYATVYIQELRQGTTSNSKGDYELRLPSGKYTVIYQSLGFAPVVAGITLDDQEITKDVVLQMQYYEIPEVRISASGEDPAYMIMRKAIGMAPYYQNNISYYKAEVYLKGDLVIRKIPRLLTRQMKVESSGGKKSKETTLREGDSYMMESFNELEFTAPDKYHQKVMSSKSTFPEEGNEISPMDYIQASFYQPVIANMAISPLSPSAFSHYNFRYLGASPEGKYTIDKIRVTPKRKSQQLFEGTIYIVEDLWCLHSVDLTNENLIGKIRVRQLYIPVQDDIWLPVSHMFDINISIMGVRADAGYGSSVKYTDVKPNPALQKPGSISADYATGNVASDTAISKTRQQIDKILEKDKLSNRDMVKLSKLMEKESERISDSGKKDLEIKDNITHEIAEDAGKKDSSYWAGIRPIPLTEVEKRSIRVADSIKAASGLRSQRQDTGIIAEKKKKSMFLNALRQVGLGYTWYNKQGSSFTFGGLIDPGNLSFNTVDGFIYGFDFRLSKKWKNNSSLDLFPDIRYAFSREQLMWRFNANYNLDRLRHSQIFLRTGMISRDIASGPGINPLLNTAFSLLLKQNYLKLYDSRYVTMGFRTEITNGLEIELSPGFEYRHTLQNTTDFSFFKRNREYTANVPVNQNLGPDTNPLFALRNQRHYEFVTKVTFTPYLRYKIDNGNKIPVGSDWPVFVMTWEHGMNEYSELEKKLQGFDMLRLDVSRNQPVGALSRFRWRLSTAGFLDNGTLPFYDFLNFNTQPLALQISDYEDAFMIPAFYSMSSPEVIGEMHLKYTTPYLLLKFLPFLSNTLMRESVSLSYLHTFAGRTNYTEAGYSLSQIFLVGELGIYAGFDDLRYKSIGLKIAFHFK